MVRFRGIDDAGLPLPLGVGAITLVLQGWVNIQSSLPFTIMEGAAFIAAVVWYWRNARKYPNLGVILPIMPLFFAWRSLWPYFLYVDIILLAVVMQEYGTSSGTPRTLDASS